MEAINTVPCQHWSSMDLYHGRTIAKHGLQQLSPQQRGSISTISFRKNWKKTAHFGGKRINIHLHWKKLKTRKGISVNGVFLRQFSAKADSIAPFTSWDVIRWKCFVKKGRIDEGYRWLNVSSKRGNHVKPMPGGRPRTQRHFARLCATNVGTNLLYICWRVELNLFQAWIVPFGRGAISLSSLLLSSNWRKICMKQEITYFSSLSWS